MGTTPLQWKFRMTKKITYQVYTHCQELFIVLCVFQKCAARESLL
jgi:hypothetical protein